MEPLAVASPRIPAGSTAPPAPCRAHGAGHRPPGTNTTGDTTDCPRGTGSPGSAEGSGEGTEIQGSLGSLQSQSSIAVSSAELRECHTHTFEAQTS